MSFSPAPYSRLHVAGPTPTAESEAFWRAAAAGELQVLACRDCRTMFHYPRSICPNCWSTSLSWTTVSGRGKLATWSVQHRPGNAQWAELAPYTIGLVRITEGPVLLSTILVEPHQLHAEMDLKVRFVDVGLFSLPMFEAS